MFDDIMYNVIIADLRGDEMTDLGYHSKETAIKKKLNIYMLCVYKTVISNL